MSTIHPDLSIPELIKFIKHSFRDSEFDEVQNTLMDREKIRQVKMESLVTDCASSKKQIDLLEKTRSFSVLEKCSVEEKLGRTQRRYEELDKKAVQMGETIRILRCDKLGIEEKLENSRRKCEEMEQRLVVMAKEIEEMKCDKVDANQAMEELKRKVIEADRFVQELQLKNVEANQTINELRVNRMESDKAAKVYGSSLNSSDPRIFKLETNLAKMLSRKVEDLPYLVHGTRNLAAAATTDTEEGGKDLPNFAEGGTDCLDNGKASAEANDKVVVSPEVPAISGISGCIRLAKRGSNGSAIRLSGEVGPVTAEVPSFAAGSVIVLSDSDDEEQKEVGDTTFISSEKTNKRSRTDRGDDGKRKTSTNTNSDSGDETEGKRQMFVNNYTRR